MAIFKIMPGKPKKGQKKHYNYSNEDALENLTTYIFNDQKGLVRGYFNTPRNPDTMCAAFKACARCHNKSTTGKRKAEHFVISLSEEESHSLGVHGLKQITDKFCAQFSAEYMLAYSIHENEIHKDGSITPESNLHAHIMLNPINIQSVLQFHIEKKFPKKQSAFVKDAVKQELEKRPNQ